MVSVNYDNCPDRELHHPALDLGKIRLQAAVKGHG